MADYTTLKVPDLKKLLQERSLPVSGNKAELIARLQDHDKPASASAPAASSTTSQSADATTKPTAPPPGEDEIDWDDDDPSSQTATTTTTAGAAAQQKPTAPPAAAALAAGGQGQVSNPAAVPNQQPDIDPSATSDLTVDPPSTEDPSSTTTAITKEKEPTPTPAPSFSANLPPSSIDDELAARQRRAAKFGKVEGADEAQKALERARRFGGAAAAPAGDDAADADADADAAKKETSAADAVRGLDQALPERGPRKRGRDNAEDAGGGRGKRRFDGGGRRGRGRGGGGGGARRDERAGGGGGRRDGGGGGGGGGGVRSGRITDDPAEKAKAEARAKKFGGGVAA
ncbi:MAG: hypothetical protein M1833_000615 [Piccolia ochrophora]|nr:MAG: hypothetical protein M1833_000615 [Piccolia ochrophora]